ncbi:MAG: hypothetical protein R3C30_06890 [Hyphomonadaceae bacterium]
MKLPIALGIAVAALAVAGASAQSTSRHVVIHGDGDSVRQIDANGDGWVTRAEATTAFERIFDDLDSNDDGRLDSADHREIRVHVDAPNVHVFRHGDGDEDVRVITGDLDPETEARIEREIEEAVSRAEAHAERAERHAERAEREAERHAEHVERVIERAMERAERDAERAERHVQRFREGDREVIVIRTGEGEGTWTSLEGGVTPVAPVPPIPPVPPVPAVPFMMLIANSEEADRNGDGALSREEFVAQHLRFFDASDANGDGRVRFDPPAPPPEPPAPPAPPEPPRRR